MVKNKGSIACKTLCVQPWKLEGKEERSNGRGEVECQCDRHEENYEILITMRVWKYLNGVPDNGKRNNVTNDSDDAVDEGNTNREGNLVVTINTKSEGGVSRRKDDLRESFNH